MVPILKPNTDMVRFTSGLAQAGHATATWLETNFSKFDPHVGQWYS